ncbi:hypothetical protein D1BOALGB6SA_6497 [Olavius sp. associated proteobacterium Delta 1]|nr:hypothetical protein D1BOALGB6SA_6497 [Olavius sp. associated proteobacterium Delta 1]
MKIEYLRNYIVFMPSRIMAETHQKKVPELVASYGVQVTRHRLWISIDFLYLNTPAVSYHLKVPC